MLLSVQNFLCEDIQVPIPSNIKWCCTLITLTTTNNTNDINPPNIQVSKQKCRIVCSAFTVQDPCTTGLSLFWNVQLSCWSTKEAIRLFSSYSALNVWKSLEHKDSVFCYFSILSGYKCSGSTISVFPSIMKYSQTLLMPREMLNLI